MPISLECQCGQKLAVKEKLEGKTIKCPKCGKTLKVHRGAAAAVSPPKDASATSDMPYSIADLLDEAGVTASKTGRRCSECDADMETNAIICVQCGFNTETGRRLKTKRDIKGPR